MSKDPPPLEAPASVAGAPWRLFSRERVGEESFGESITARHGDTCLSFQYSRLRVEDGEASLSYINKFKVSLGCPRKVKECVRA